jgi:tetratricopeptide (TPR) repeat protein
MKLQDRITLYRERLDREPRSRSFAPLADLLRQDGRLQEALKIVDAGLASHPAYISALVIRGRILLELGRLDEARESLRSVLRHDAENVLVLRLLADDARQQRAWAEAIPLMEKLAVLDTQEQAWLEAIAEARQQLAPAAAPAEPAGERGFATMTLVDILLAQGYRDKAAAALEEMLQRDPGRTDAREKLDQLKGAFADGRNGIAVPPGHGAPALAPADRTEPQPMRGDPLEARRRLLEGQRNRDKKQFEDWLDKIRQDGGIGS